MRPSPFARPLVPVLASLALLAAAGCDRREQQEALSTDPQTVEPADRDANRNPDADAGITAQDVDGRRTAVPPPDSVEQGPLSEPVGDPAPPPPDPTPTP
ncbi:hypothetical protein [Luteimonas sp. FCS-9]|uniref:hypothetical protein n=1 Tax=Luteimonas sp. FCS-9 TaxID=1547516 RepID=UPI00063EBD5E|nr:hypothetical protein [Luteimonas sp. FCS-9]KLI99434.1 hypothetical protein WQ56_12360 [Luteimonas sp. FCS-9]